MIQNIIDNICDDFAKQHINNKKVQSYGIFINNERVKVISGKKVWNSIGAAKSAFNRHVYYYVHRASYGSNINYLSLKDITKNIIKELIDKKILEIKEI